MRLLGIDLFRIIATFGVIAIHGLLGVPMDSSALKLVHVFSAFAVPFFLATAFYLTGITLQSRPDKFSLKKRMQRILVPFACWTVIYLVARAVKQFISNDHSFDKLVADPTGLLFGSAGLQLYFLPQLATGTIVIYLITRKLNVKNLKYLAILAAASLIVLAWLQSTDNLFKLGQGVALVHLFPNLYTKPVFREAFVLIAWVASCLPYIFFSLIVSGFHFKSMLERNQTLKMSTFIALISTVCFASIIFLYDSNVYLSILISYSALVLGLCLSNFIKDLSVLQKVASYTFGIYLVHALFTDSLVPLLQKLHYSFLPDELSIISLLVGSLIIFGLSLVLTFLISLDKLSSKLLLGE